MLDKAGVTEELLALKLREGLDAERTIAVSVIKEDGVITGKELIKEADMAVRHRYLSSVATLRGMTPQMEKIRIDIESRNVNVQDMNVSLSAGLEGLQGAALLAEFTKRMALYSSGQALPVVPEVMERVAAVGDVPVVYAAVVAVEPDTGRKITDLPCFLAERAAMAQAATPTTPDGRIVFDPTTGEIIETIELRAERVSDVRRAAVAVGKRAEKCAGTMASGMLRGLPKIRGRKWVTGASGELISVAREDLSQ